MPVSEDRVRITIEGPKDQVLMDSNREYSDATLDMYRYVVASPFRTVTVRLGPSASVGLELLAAPEPPKVYTQWLRNTEPFGEYTKFRVDEGGQWQIFRNDVWQDCTYIKSFDDLAFRAHMLRKLRSA